MIVEVVSPVDHKRLVPVTDNVEEPQLFKTVTIGAAGPGAGLAIPDPFTLVQPATVCVTV